jgi:hypothetical protein
MNQLIMSIGLIVGGIILLIAHSRVSKTQKEESALSKPYMKNAAWGLIMFGMYFMAKDFLGIP